VDSAGAERVKAAIAAGLSLKMQGTPTFVIDGKTYPGRVPDEVLEPYVK
jgi:protein-disulfide isomerase